MKTFKLISAILLIVSFSLLSGCSVSKQVTKDDELFNTELNDESLPPELKEHIDNLYSLDAYVRADSAMQIGKMGKTAAPAVPYLIQALKHYLNNFSSYNILVTLRKINPYWNNHESVKTLALEFIFILNDDDESSRIRSAAAIELGRLGNLIAVDHLVNTLKNYDESKLLRGSAAYGLSFIGDIRAVEPLIDALNDESQWLRMMATVALGQIGDYSAINPLTIMLNDSDKHVRKSAAYALGQMKVPGAVNSLISALNDDFTLVRGAAAYGLSYMGDFRAIEPLIHSLDDKDDNIREIISLALQRLTGEDFGMDQDKWMKWWKEYSSSLSPTLPASKQNKSLVCLDNKYQTRLIA